MARMTDDQVEALIGAALTARADLVREADLGRTASPGADVAAVRTLPTRSPRGRRWVPVVAAAAVGAVVTLALSVPVLLGQEAGDGSGPAGTPTVVDAPAPDDWVGGTGEGGPGSDLPYDVVVAGDLDGDGAADEVRFRSVVPYGPAGAGPVRVEVELTSDEPGTVRWTVLRHRAVNAYPVGPGSTVQLDRDPGRELLVAYERDRSGDTELAVVDLVDGRLLEADQPPAVDSAPTGDGVPPLRATAAAGGSSTTWFAEGDDVATTLLSGRTAGAVTAEEGPRRYDVWSWRLLAPTSPGERPRLAATFAGQRCTDGITGSPRPCGGIGEPLD